MNARLEALEAEALKLPASDRSHLLERLVASLDRNPEIESAWADEADRREQARASGEAVSVPGDEAIRRLRDRLRQWVGHSTEQPNTTLLMQ